MQKIKNKAKRWFALAQTSALVLGAAGVFNTSVSAEEKPDTWIADREITGLIFQSAGDAAVDIPQEIVDEIKKRTGITLKLQVTSGESSTQALAAGLAAGDLPDFISFYLNNSGRPEMQFLLKAANEGQFHDISAYLKEGEVYGKYFEEGYLPTDTRDNIMFRDGMDGPVHLVHMNIPRYPNDHEIPKKPSVGGMYIRKDIAEDMGITEPGQIKTSEELADLARKIHEKGYTDKNGAPVTAIGPTSWGGSDRDSLYRDMVWTRSSGEKFMKTEDGKILHESQTEHILNRVKWVQELMDEGVMHPEFYTMEENRAQEGILNGSFAIISDTYNYRPEIASSEYVPLGDLQRVDGSTHEIMTYKSGYAGWAIPTTTENPEEVVKFADWCASREGKMLYIYGLEGRDYTLDENGMPIVNPEVVEEFDTNPEKARQRGFRGVRHWWGEHLGWTDHAHTEDFGESTWAENYRESQDTEEKYGDKIGKMFDWEKIYDEAEVIDGLTPQSFLFEFEGNEGGLTTALERYNEDVQRMYFADSIEDAEKILEETRKNLEDNGLNDFLEFLEKKEAEGVTIRF